VNIGHFLNLLKYSRGNRSYAIAFKIREKWS